MWEEPLSTVGMHLLSGGEEEAELEFECEEVEVEPNVVLFTFFMLLVGLVTLQFLNKVPVPYTAQLLIIGLGLGFLHKELSTIEVEGEGGLTELEGEEGSERRLLSGGEPPIEEFRWTDRYDRLGIGLQVWTGMNPELLLLLFLPALIFASAFSLQFHIVKRVFWQILLLAGPGVVLGTAMVAVFAKYVFPYDWCWPKALMFGAMLSATDPVAVVALLKEVGASAKLGHVIEGESLFNDGTAFVFFLLFRDMISVTSDCFDDEAERFTPHCDTISRDVGESIGFFARLALGGPALGIGCGIVATLWIKCIFNNIFMEISLTLVSAYLTFYLAEDVLEVSGVLAVVALGIFMSTFARDSVSSEVHEPMHVFWEMMEYFANTMIFVYTGAKVAIEIYEQNNTGIQNTDWGYAVILYLALNVFRALTIALLYPILVKLGYGLTLKDSIVMTWGGLRGAVGLALALIVELDENKLPPDFRALTIFYMGTMAASTLIINGTSMPYLLKMLGTTKTSPEKLEVLLHVIKDMEDCDATQFEYDPLLGDADTETVLRIAAVDTSKIIPKTDEVQRVLNDAAEARNPALVGIGEQLSRQGLHRRSAPGTMQSSLNIAIHQDPKKKTGKWWWPFGKKSSKPQVEEVNVTQEMLVKDLRSRFFQGVKASYSEWLEEKIIRANQSFDLKEATDKSLDVLGEPISDWAYLKTLAAVPAWRVHIQRLGVIIPTDFVRKPLQRMLFDGVEHTVLCARALIHAHSEAEQAIGDYIRLGKKNTSVAGVIQKLMEAGEIVISESRIQAEQAQEFVKNIKQAFPEITRSIKTKMVAQHILLDKLQYIEKLHKAGLIEAREAEGLETLIAKKMKKLAFHPPKLELPEAKDLLHSHPLFSDISRSVFESEVMPHARHKLFQPKSEIFTLGGVPQHVTLVVQGLVQVILPSGKTQRQEGTGAILGMSEVLLGQHRGRTLIAETLVGVYQIEAEVFLGLVARHVGLWRRAWQMAGAFLTIFHPWGEFKGMSYQQIQTVFRNAKIIRYKKHDEMTVEGSALLIKGKVREVKLDGTQIGEREAPEPLGPGPAYYVCSSIEVFVAKIPKSVQRRSGPPEKLKRISMVHGRLSTVSLSRTVAEQALSLPRNSLNLGNIPEEFNQGAPAPQNRTSHMRADSAPVHQMIDGVRAAATGRANENGLVPRN